MPSPAMMRLLPSSWNVGGATSQNKTIFLNPIHDDYSDQAGSGNAERKSK